MSPERNIPTSLEQLHRYLEAEKVEWGSTIPGTEVIVETQNTETGDISYFPITLIDKEPLENGLFDAWVELGEQAYEFFQGSNREPVNLPAGTIMKGSGSCQHFPVTSTLMVYLGGISANRDYSFEEIMTPDREITLGEIFIPNITKLYSFAPDGEYQTPEAFKEYKRLIRESNISDQARQDQYEAELDGRLSKKIEQLFSEEEAKEIRDLADSFHIQGRYRICCLLEHAEIQDKTGGFLPALKKAIEEEFTWSPAEYRGYPSIPANARGWALFVSELGLKRPSS
jgi:hypothetical protein